MARRATFRLTPPVVPEHPLQKQIADCLKLEIAPAGKLSKFGAIWFSVDHANFAGEVPGVRIGRGIIAGIPDVFVLYRGRAYLIEIKSTNGSLSDAQSAVMAAAILAGVRCAVVDTVDDVLRALDEWQVPRKRRLMLAMPDEVMA